MSDTKTSALPKQQVTHPPGQYVSVYMTSKRIHATKLLDLRGDWPHLYFTARWPVVRDISAEQNRPARLWLQDNVDDMNRSDVVVCYAENDDIMSGSLWEVGVAWALGKTIYLVGENAGYKEWQHAPRIKHVLRLETALTEASDRLRYDRNDVTRLMDAIGALGERLGVVEQAVKARG